MGKESNPHLLRLLPPSFGLHSSAAGAGTASPSLSNSICAHRLGVIMVPTTTSGSPCVRSEGVN